ncbi:MAG: hypothetical protein ACTSYL_03365 [Candidatus Thorarchaeota archaeon]
MSPYLREDTDFYCLIWLGVAVLGAFYFNFGYLFLMGVISFSSIFGALAPVLGLPILMIFFFVGYMRPPRGKIKGVMIALALVSAIFYAIFAFAVPTAWGGGLGLAIWGTGGAFLTAAGFAIIPPLDESTSPGLLDVHSLPYAKRVKPEPIPEPASEPEPTEAKDDSADN